uniref:Uncharacterized protein n=1 Tax=Anguilla anguilla TaxID=7936 RepID=A0A0E9QJV8_ANGAN
MNTHLTLALAYAWVFSS